MINGLAGFKNTLCLSGFSLIKGDKKNAFLYKEGGSDLSEMEGLFYRKSLFRFAA
jgi:hypothetical protein